MTTKKTVEELLSIVFEAGKQVRIRSTWRHRAGELYIVERITIDEKAQSPRVVYHRSEWDGDVSNIMFDRPLEEFLEKFKPVKTFSTLATEEEIENIKKYLGENRTHVD